jgi:hypothetical protein
LAVGSGWLLTKRLSRRGRDLRLHFQLWVYLWTSVGLRYQGLKERDLALHSVSQGFDVSTLLEPADVDVLAERLRGDAKARLQSRHTHEGLRRLVAAAAAPAEGSSEEPRAIPSS